MNLEKLTFRKLKRGETVAERPFTDSALLNTYESFSRTLAEIRTFIKARARDGTALHEKLKDNFGRTELGRAATDENWMTWVGDFLKENATAGNVALVFLEEKTGLKRGTLKVRFSAARNKRKRRN
jgi:tRNA C32,U32 (ribose-2'-O)-methylase TrmJ